MSAIRDLPPITDWRRPWRQPAFWGVLAALCLIAGGAVYVLDVIGSAADVPAEYLWLALAVFAALGVTALGISALAAQRRLALVSGSLEAENDLLVRSLEAEPHARLIAGPEGEAVYANSAFSALFALGPSAALERLEYYLGDEDETARQVRRLRDIAGADEVGHGEIRFASPSGRTEWLEVSACPLKGRPGFVLWCITDITSRRQMEQVIREEQEKLVDFLENASVGFYSADAEGRFQYINHTLAEWLGHTPEEILKGKMELADFLPADRPAGVPAYDPFAGKRPDQQGEVAMRRRDGATFQVYIIQTVIEDEGGVRTRSVVRDLSPERELEQDLRLSEQRFQRLFEDAPIGIAILDLDGRITECNRAFGAMAPAGPPGPVGKSLAELVAEDDRAELVSRLSGATAGTATAAPFDVRLPGEGEGEGEKVVSLSVTRMEDDAGRLSGLILHSYDTTAQRELEAQFTQSQKMQAVGQLAGGVAHDFNNLLTVIIGFCDLLLLRHSAGEQNFADIMQIKQNANRATNLVRQLLAFSRQQTLQPKVLNITDVLAELTNLLRRLIGVNIQFDVVHGRDLGLVKVDHGQFEQVIINLAVNARDAMAEGGTLTIRTSDVAFDRPFERGAEILPAGEYVLIEVTDTGTGIEKKHLERIFEPFFSTKEVGQGTGLGLSTAYGIVKQTGGFITVDSELGSGTTFAIYLPRHEAEDGAEAAPAAADRQPPRDLTGVGTVLLVEDEDAVRMIGARALTSKGYKVIEASDGGAALEVIRAGEEAIDLVITDVVMPNIDGPTLVREVREIHPDMKVIFISGYAEDSFRDKVSEDSDIHFLPKPFSLEQLAGKVKEVLAV
ncbi:MAG: PAS domain S-box protein [Proteobacteria bacterium]|nr:PAS domain S-box protein [Pseudomonadota bacterium]